MKEKIQTIPRYRNINRITELKRWGSKSKFVVEIDGKKEIVEFGEEDWFNRKIEEAKILNKVSKVGVPTICPIELGELETGIYYYRTSFMEGTNAKSAKTTLTKKELYQAGIEAGKVLKKIHTLSAPHAIGTWCERAVQKHNRYLKAYHELEQKIDGACKAETFIENHKELLNNRPSTLQHDDFHLENIIINNKQFAGVIDFGNFDYGDPYFDFVKLAIFQRKESVDFAIGQLYGYFDNQVPEEFWTYYSIYCAMNLFSSIVWSVKFAPEQLEEMIERLELNIADHEYFEKMCPDWFKEYEIDI